ncbi:hypothetical protein Sjap_001668 [Stephania japonica]|uniref:Uncharacterized protein n=1 Tax=Stephania japonica TaxID=461633 RepID=A0AAP0KLX6_9MAGN
MNQLKTTLFKSTNLFRTDPNRALPILHTHRFCSAATPATEQPPDQSSSPADPFLQSSNQSFVYGRLTGNGRYTMKTDIVQMFEGSDLSLQDVRVEYNRNYAPVAMIVQFPSGPSFDSAMRIVRQAPFYRLEKSDMSYWNIPSYDGKTVSIELIMHLSYIAVLLEGLPRFALPEDVERFLCGSECFTSNMQIFLRQRLLGPVKLALVQFPSQIEAMNSVILKNRNFCLNNQVLMRVLQ